MTESFIHVAMREYLKEIGWTLIAGEYPGGSDDELYVLSIMDPELARDRSPDPRRHSAGEIIPDLFAFKDGKLLIVEAKPKYSFEDKNKLIDLIENKTGLLRSSLKKFCKERQLLQGINIDTITFVPTLAFNNNLKNVLDENSNFAHIYVEEFNKARLVFFEE